MLAFCSGMAKTNRLLAYLRRNKESHRAFAERAKIRHLHPMVSQWANDRRFPGLAPALAMEEATGGDVPASYWPDRKKELRAEADAARSSR